LKRATVTRVIDILTFAALAILGVWMILCWPWAAVVAGFLMMMVMGRRI
jgi:hypothetical protein